VHASVAGSEKRVFAPAGYVDSLGPNPAGLRAVVELSGAAAVQSYVRAAVVDRVDVLDDATVEVSGVAYGVREPQFALAPNNGEASDWHSADISDGRFTVRIPTVRPDLRGVPRPLKAGGYRVVGRVPDPAGGGDEVGVLLHEPALVPLPKLVMTEPAKMKISRAWPGRVVVDVSAPIPEEVLGRYPQTRMIASYAEGERVLEDAVFFCVDLGSNAADSALAIHQELRRRGTNLRLYWGIQDNSVPVPEGGIPVLKLSPDWYEKINTSRYLVNNYGGIWGLTKHPDQRYLQTWHGTPLKYVGASEIRHRKGPDASLEKLAGEAGEWDAFVSPSPYVSELVPTEFLFSGPVLETGYPRNDRLATAGPDESADLRRLLGLPPDARTVLYAPTFRDTNRNGWAAATFSGLDLSRLLELLGPDWHLLLRGHSFNARYDRSDHSAGRIHDVTHHPDINDLYLVADVLVTDYSSAMFDYAVTGKPILFFTPDLEQYAASRGVYFDLAEVAPGPMDIDVVSLAGHLRDLDDVVAANAERYAAFKARFAPWDDGKAAARVVDAFFG
jgi:CDP-glycerol glycerophosphotransferase